MTQISPYSRNRNHWNYKYKSHYVIHSLDKPTGRRRLKPKLIKSEECWNVPAEISIVGFSRLRNDIYPKFCRFLWFCLIVTCTICCSAMLWNCTVNYLSSPIRKHVTIIRGSRVQFPAIYICPGVGRSLNHYFTNNNLANCTEPGNYSCLNDPFAEIAFNEFMQFMKIDGTVAGMWNLSYFTPSTVKLYKPCSPTDLNCTADGREWIVDTMYVKTFWGVCLAMNTVHEEDYRGPFTFFEVEVLNFHSKTVTEILKQRLATSSDEDEKKKFQDALDRHTIGILIYLHHEYARGQRHNIFFSSQDALQGFRIHAEIQRSDYILLNTTKSKCVDEKTYQDCFNQCLETNMSSLCRMPYIQKEDKYCTIYNFQPAQMKNYEVYSTFKLSRCNCLPSCTEKKYISSVDVIDEMEDEEEMIRIKLYFADDTYDETSEHVAYTVTQYLNDIAGTLGFFLGYCVLNTLEFIEFLIYLISKIKFIRELRRWN